MGACVHNFAASPCKYHLQCLTGCGDFLRETGNQKQRKAIIAVREKTKISLEKAKVGLTAEEYGASNWVNHEEAILAGANKALAVDDAAGAPVGEQQPVFPGNPSLMNKK